MPVYRIWYIETPKSVEDRKEHLIIPGYFNGKKPQEHSLYDVNLCVE